jgi:hypothetical protein
VPSALCTNLASAASRIMPGGTYKYLNNNRGQEPRYKRICHPGEAANAGAELLATGWFLPSQTWTVKPIHLAN